jgi:hypothetical protein
MIESINLAGHAITKGLMPVAGGLLDQSSWFIDLWTRLESEINAVQNEQHERAMNR